MGDSKGGGGRSGARGGGGGADASREGLGIGEDMGDMSLPVGSEGRGLTRDEANGMLAAIRALAAARGL